MMPLGTDRSGRGLDRALVLMLLSTLVTAGCRLVPSADAPARDGWSESRVAERIGEVFPDRESREITVYRTRNYILFSSARGVEPIGRLFEDVHRRFADTFPVPVHGGDLLPVYLFATSDEYRRFYVRHTGVTAEIAGLSIGHAWQDYVATSIPLEQEAIVHHEGVHQLMLARAGYTGGGSWFHEGLAEYFERTVRPAGFEILVGAELRSAGFTLEEIIRQPQLLDPSWGHQSSTRAIRLYALAASFIEFLHRGPHARHFGEFLRVIGEGPPFDPGFVARQVRAIYGLSLADLDQQWRRYWLDGDRQPPVLTAPLPEWPSVDSD